MKKNIFTVINKKEKGFTLFIALIVSSILLAVGFSIGNIILKQIKLSTAGKESQIAFYAADSGADCALYWDRKDSAGDATVEGAFGTTTNANTAQNIIKCGSGVTANGDVIVASKTSDDLRATTTFYINYTNPTDSTYVACAKVTVAKTNGGNNTTIDARGYNAAFVTDRCDTTSNPRIVERGLLLTY